MQQEHWLLLLSHGCVQQLLFHQKRYGWYQEFLFLLLLLLLMNALAIAHADLFGCRIFCETAAVTLHNDYCGVELCQIKRWMVSMTP
jgi:hypothetical protein